MFSSEKPKIKASQSRAQVKGVNDIVVAVLGPDDVVSSVPQFLDGAISSGVEHSMLLCFYIGPARAVKPRTPSPKMAHPQKEGPQSCAFKSIVLVCHCITNPGISVAWAERISTGGRFNIPIVAEGLAPSWLNANSRKPVRPCRRVPHHAHPPSPPASSICVERSETRAKSSIQCGPASFATPHGCRARDGPISCRFATSCANTRGTERSKPPCRRPLRHPVSVAPAVLCFRTFHTELEEWNE